MNEQPEQICGRSQDDLRADVADGREDRAHLATCPSCRVVAEETRRAWAPLVLLARQPVVAPPGLTRSVLRRVRAARPATTHLLPGEGPGSTRVSGRVLARLARLSATAVPGVAGAVARDLAGDAAGEAVLVVEIALTARYGTDLPGLAARVRRTVRADLAAATGLHGVRVDVVVDDVHDG